MEHLYRGACPDPAQPDMRDPECPACEAESAMRRDAERFRWLLRYRAASLLNTVDPDGRHDYPETRDLIDAKMKGANA